jgi:hypothetical protein
LLAQYVMVWPLRLAGSLAVPLLLLSEPPPHAVTVRPSAATRAVAARSLLEVLEVRIPVPSQGGDRFRK